MGPLPSMPEGLEQACGLEQLRQPREVACAAAADAGPAGQHGHTLQHQQQDPPQQQQQQQQQPGRQAVADLPAQAEAEALSAVAAASLVRPHWCTQKLAAMCDEACMWARGADQITGMLWWVACSCVEHPCMVGWHLCWLIRDWWQRG